MRFFAVGLLVLAGCHTAHATQPVTAAPSASGIESARMLQEAFVDVADDVSGAVVAIHPGSSRGRTHRADRAMGSGIVVRADGYVLTNGHVVRDAGDVEVALRDGRRLAAKIIGIDTATDLAVLKVEAIGLAAARLADSSRVRPGQWVIAIGSPFGLDYTVTVGVVSAVGRGVGMNEIEDYLQTDASINPGNSGGPLVNLDGEVVGINTMIVRGGTGIGMAIPSSLARNVVDQLIATGSVRRAYVGVAFQEVTPVLAQELGLQGQGGALVTAVEPHGPAELAGIVVGDVIVSIDGQVIAESRDLLRVVIAKPIGAALQLEVVRDKQPRTVQLVTIERPGELRARKRNSGLH